MSLSSSKMGLADRPRQLSRAHNTEGADPLLVGPVPRRWIRGPQRSGQVGEMLEFVESLGISLAGVRESKVLTKRE